MAILDTFVSIFEADTDDLEKGYSSSKKKTEELSDSLKKTEDQAQQTTASLVTLAKRAAIFFAGVMAANVSLKMAVERATEVDSLSRFSSAIDDTIENVDAFARSMQRLGVDRSEAEKGLASIYANMDKVGISANSATDAMYQLSDKVSRLDPAKAKEYLSIVGITDKRMVDAMMKGRSHLAEMMRTQKEAGVTTKESAENAMAFNEALGRLNEGVDRAKSRIGDALSPAFTFLLSKLADLVDWAHQNEPFIIAFATSLAVVFGTVLAPSLWSAASGLWALISPFVAVIAAGLAVASVIALIVDDIYNFIKGNDSLVGSLIEKYPIIEDVFLGIWDFLKEFWGFLVSVFEGIVDLPNKLSDFGVKLKAQFKEPIESIKSMFGSLWNFILDIFDSIMDVFDSIALGYQKAKSYVGFKDKEAIKEIEERRRDRSLRKEERRAELDGVRKTETGGAVVNSINNLVSQKQGDTTVVEGDTVENLSTNIEGDTIEGDVVSGDVYNSQSSSDSSYDYSDRSLTENKKVGDVIYHNETNNYDIEERSSIEKYPMPAIISGAAVEAIKQLQETDGNEYNTTSTQAISNSSSIKNDTKISVGDIHVTTSADADEVVAVINDSLEKQLEQLASEYNTEIAR